MTNFQTIVILLLAIFLVVGVLIFAGILPGFRDVPGGAVGSVTLWGTIPSDMMVPLINQFNDANKETVTVVYQAKNPTTYETDLIEALAALRGPDLFFLPQDWVLRHRDKISTLSYQTLPLRDLKNNFIEEANLFFDSSGVLALPLYVDPLVLYYNKELLSSAGLTTPPATWTRLKLDVSALNRFDDRRNILDSAVALGQSQNITHAKDILSTLLFQAGNPVVTLENNSPRVVLDDSLGFVSPPAIRVVDFFNQFSNPSAATYSWNRSLPQAIQAFAAGNLAYYFGYPSELNKIRELNPHLNFDVAVIPQKDEGPKITFGRLMGLAISRQSRKPSGAGVASRLLTQANFTKALSDKIFLPPARRDLLGSRHPDPSMEVFYRSAVIARAFLDPDPEATKEIFRNLIEATVTGRLDTQNAVGTASRELNQLFN